MAARVFDILLIDDNPGDCILIEDAWAQCTIVKSKISILRETRDAMRYLRSAAPYVDSPRPDLIMLDYHMPVDGGVALTEIKGDPDFLQIPVVVLTGSQNPKDIHDIYSRHANCCFRKPSDLDALVAMVCDIANHWLLKVVRPPVLSRK